MGFLSINSNVTIPLPFFQGLKRTTLRVMFFALSIRELYVPPGHRFTHMLLASTTHPIQTGSKSRKGPLSYEPNRLNILDSKGQHVRENVLISFLSGPYLSLDNVSPQKTTSQSNHCAEEL